jgi:predicted NBD/HSP70 family sugar kinase
MILAVDIGGTKTLLGLFSEKGELIKTYKFPTPLDYSEFMAQLIAEAQTFIAGHKLEHAVVAVPGMLDRVKGIGIRFGNLTWENVPIGPELSKALKVPVDIENDAKLAGLSEALLLPQYKKVQYVTISTGINGAYVVDGRLDQNLINSEIGHMMLEHEGRIKPWESFASGKAIFNKFGLRASDITDSRTWYIVARNIAIGLIDVIATTTPDAIVIGGGVGTHLDKFKDRLEEDLKIYQTNVVNIPPIFKAQNPEEAVIYGCYALAQQLKK